MRSYKFCLPNHVWEIKPCILVQVYRIHATRFERILMRKYTSPDHGCCCCCFGVIGMRACHLLMNISARLYTLISLDSPLWTHSSTHTKLISITNYCIISLHTHFCPHEKTAKTQLLVIWCGLKWGNLLLSLKANRNWEGCCIVEDTRNVLKHFSTASCSVVGVGWPHQSLFQAHSKLGEGSIDAPLPHPRRSPI